MTQTTVGSCLCGTVKFQISGEFESFFSLSLQALSKGHGVCTCGQFVFIDSDGKLGFWSWQHPDLPGSRTRHAKSFWANVGRFSECSIDGAWWLYLPGVSIARSTSDQVRISALQAGRNGTRIWKTFAKSMVFQDQIAPMPADPLSILKTVYGYDTFRGRQRDIIEHVIAGNHAFVLMPTGGGKSLCYQIPALVASGHRPRHLAPHCADGRPGGGAQTGRREGGGAQFPALGRGKGSALARYRAGRVGPPLHGPGNAFEAREPRPAEIRAPLSHRHRRGPLPFAMGP